MSAGFQTTYRISHDPRVDPVLPHREPNLAPFPPAKEKLLSACSREVLQRCHFQTESGSRLARHPFRAGDAKKAPLSSCSASQLKLAPTAASMTFCSSEGNDRRATRSLVCDSTLQRSHNGRHTSPLADQVFQEGVNRSDRTIARLQEMRFTTRDPSTIPRFHYETASHGLHPKPQQDTTGAPVTIHSFRKNPTLAKDAQELCDSIKRPPSAPHTPRTGTRISHGTQPLSFPKNTALRTTNQEFFQDQSGNKLFQSSKDPIHHKVEVPQLEARPRLDTTMGSSYRRGCTRRPDNTFAKSHTFDKIKGHLRHDGAGIGCCPLEATKKLNTSGCPTSSAQVVSNHFLSTTRKMHAR